MNKPKPVIPDPFELLKSAGQQIAGGEAPLPAQAPEADKPIVDQKLEQELNMQKTRRLQALEQEITNIRNLRNQKPSEETPPREVPAPLTPVSSKPDRKFAGEGLGAKRQQTHVEKPLPPSG